MLLTVTVLETTLPRPDRRRIYGLIEGSILRKGAHEVGRGVPCHGVQRLVQIYGPAALRQQRGLLRGRCTSIIEVILVTFYGLLLFRIISDAC